MSGAAAPAANSLTVEFLGIPGAGKTTLVRAVATALRAMSLPVAEPGRRIGPDQPPVVRLARKIGICAGAATSASLFLRAEMSVLSSRQPGARDCIARSVQVQIARRLLQRASVRPGMTLLDEGLLQALWSTGLRGRHEPLLRHVGSTPEWPLPDVLVVVATPPETALARLVSRDSSHSRTQRLPAEEQLGELRLGEGLVLDLVSWFRSCAGDRRVVEVSGTGLSAGTAEDVASRIRSLSGR